MRQQLVSKAIILTRIDYGEADRILTLLTPDYGKLRLLAKGVRRVKSKLAGGIELFSVSTITFVYGRGEIGTLISTRLIKHYAGIVKDYERTSLGYDLIKQLNKVTEDEPEASYFILLQQAFEALDDFSVPIPLIRTWFGAQLLKLNGHRPNLETDHSDNKLKSDQTYNFDYDHMTFRPEQRGHYNANHIKLLRLIFGGNTPIALAHVRGNAEAVQAIAPLVSAMLQSILRV